MPDHAVNYAPFRFRIEIYQYVTAENQVESSAWIGVGIQIEPLKSHACAQFGCRFHQVRECPSAFKHVALSVAFGQLRRLADRPHSVFGPRERLAGNVGCQNLNFPVFD